MTTRRWVLLALVVGLGVLLVRVVGTDRGSSSVGPSSEDVAPVTSAPHLAPRLEDGERAYRSDGASITAWVWGTGGTVDAQVRMVLVPPGATNDEARALLASNRAWYVTASAKRGVQVRRPASMGLALVPVGSDGRWGTVFYYAARFVRRVHAISLRLHDGPCGLRVRVLDAAGRPVRGRVHLYAPASRIGGDLPMDGEGWASFGGLHAGAYRVHVHAKNRVWALSMVVLPREDPLVVHLPAASHMQDASILESPSGHPVPHGHVLASGRTERGIAWQQRVAFKDGRARISVPGGIEHLGASAPGWTSGRRLEGPIPSPAVIHMARLPDVDVIVRDADGMPVQGVLVHATGSLSGALHHFGLLDSARTDERGHARMEPLDASPFLPWVLDGSWASTNLTRLERGRLPGMVVPRPGEGSLSTSLSVVPSARLVGQVLDAEGAPLAHAVVTCDMEVERWSDPSPSSHWDEVSPFARLERTDAQGRFRVDALTPGMAWQIHVGHPRASFSDDIERDISSRPPGFGTSVTLEPGEQRTLTIRASGERSSARTGPVDVRVHDAEGGPVPHAFVTWRGSDTASRAPQHGIADASGHLRIRDPHAGEMRVEARAPSGLPAWVDVPAVATTCTIQLSPGGDVRFNVRLPDGSPVFHAETSFLQRGEMSFDSRMEVIWPSDGQVWIRALDDDLSHVVFTTKLRGTRWQARAPLASGNASGAVLEVTLQPVLEGASEEPLADDPQILVVGSEGQPLGSVKATVLRPASFRWVSDHKRTLEGGRGPVPFWQGAHWVEIHSATWQSGTPAPFGVVRFGPYEAGRTMPSGEVRLPPERVVRGRVTDASGRALDGVRVTAIPVPPEGMGMRSDGEICDVRTDAEGRFVLRGLGDVEVDLRVYPTQDLSGTRRRVHPPVEDLEIRVDAWVNAEIRVVDDRGQPVSGARIAAGADPVFEIGANDRPQIPDRSGTTDDDGRVRLEELLPSEAYHLKVSPPALRTDLLAIEDPSWRPRDEVIVLRRGHELHGEVVDPEGRPLSHVHVFGVGTGTGRSSPSARGRSDSGGRFHLEGLPAGEAAISVTLGAHVIQMFEVTRVTVPHKGPVRLVVDPGRSLDVDLTAFSQGQEVHLQLVRLDDEGDVQGVAASQGVRGKRWAWRGLPAEARYLVWATTGRDTYARAACATVEAGESTAVLDDRDGGRVRIRVPALGRQKRFFVRLVSPKVRNLSHWRDGAVTMPLPAGTWTVEVAAVVGGRKRSTRLEVSPGDDLDVVLPDPVDDD